MTVSVEIPRYYQFHWPIIVALRELGDCATIEELNSRVITDGGYTEEQQAVLWARRSCRADGGGPLDRLKTYGPEKTEHRVPRVQVATVDDEHLLGVLCGAF